MTDDLYEIKVDTADFSTEDYERRRKLAWDLQVLLLSKRSRQFHLSLGYYLGLQNIAIWVVVLFILDILQIAAIVYLIVK